MRRRTFLLALGWLSLMGPGRPQTSPEQIASLLLGEPVEQVPPDLIGDLMRAERDEAAARRALARLVEGRAWRWVDFANPPARPPAHRSDWSRPWKAK
ncbi:MAG: hypothetical protein U0931_02250 [Vulcanimicrobiota bacterium]